MEVQKHDIEIFKGKRFSSLMQDIYNNSNKKDRMIKGIIGELRTYIKNIGDATLIAPLIKDYLDLSVKNDDQLVKLAAIVQRITAVGTKSESGVGDSFMLSDEEKKQLLEELDDIEFSSTAIDKKLQQTTTKMKALPMSKNIDDELEELVQDE